jgi:predicted MFS family arabinose efflux permease
VATTPVPLSRNRDFLLLWWGQAISTLGSRMSQLAYPLLVLELTGSASRAGLVGFVDTVPLLLFYLPAGALVDRWDRKRVMLVCDAGRGIALGAVAVLLVAGDLPYWVILVAAFVEGTLSVFFQLAQMTALIHVVAPEQMQTAFARNEARTFGAGVIGQPLGGVLFGVAQSLPFIADAVSYVVSYVMVFLVRASFHEEKPRSRERMRKEIADGFRWLWGQPFLRACAFLIAGSNFVWSAMYLVVIVRMRDDLGATGGVIGLSFALVGIGGLLGSLAAPRIHARVASRSIVIGAAWVWAVLLPLLSVPTQPLVMGVLFAGMSAVGPVWNVTVVAYRMSIVPDRLAGRVNAVARLIATSAIPLAQLVSGIMLDHIGAVSSMWVLTGTSVVVAIVTSLVPSVRQGPSADPASQPATSSA